jgi:hypothetical protein
MMALFLVHLKSENPTADDAVAIRAYMKELGAVEVVMFEWMITSPKSVRELADDLAHKLGSVNRLAIQEVTQGL